MDKIYSWIDTHFDELTSVVTMMLNKINWDKLLGVILMALIFVYCLWTLLLIIVLW